MDPAAFASRYTALSALHARMLACARSAQWEELAAMQADYAAQAAELAALTVPPMAPAQAESLAAQARALMAEEAELRALIAPQMAHLAAFNTSPDTQLAHATGAQRKLDGAYGR